MPVRRGRDAKGNFFKFGKTGRRYYYKAGDKTSRTRARNKAAKQGRAVKRAQTQNDAFQLVKPVGTVVKRKQALPRGRGGIVWYGPDRRRKRKRK